MNQSSKAHAIGKPRVEAQSSAEGGLGDRVRALRLPAPEDSRTASTAWLPWMLCAVLAITTSCLGYLAWSRQARLPAGALGTALADARVTQDQAATTAPGASAESAAGRGAIVLESKGYIVPAHQILVTPQVSGRLLMVAIEEGMRVRQGQVLAEIERTEYQADHDRAQASLELARQRLLELERGNRPEEISRAEAELAEAQVQLPQLESQWQRYQQLRGTNAVAALELEQSESAYRAMQRRVDALTHALALMRLGPRLERIEAARAAVALAEAELAKARWRLDNCTVRAPVSGSILKKNAEEGNIVNPIAFNGSFSLCEMADLSDLEVDLDIQERDVARVFPGQRCTVRADAHPERAYDGVVSRLMPIANRAKGAVPVRVKLSVPSNEEGVYLKPEMGAVVSFLAAESPPDSSPAAPAQQRRPQADKPQEVPPVPSP